MTRHTKPPAKAPSSPMRGTTAPRMRPALREAVHLIATHGHTQRHAASVVGMNEKALSRALARPPIAQHLEDLKAFAIIESDQIKKMAKAAAVREGLRLMTESKSEQVRARMVEFFAGKDAKGVTVNVQNNVQSGGYEYARPNDRIVEIRQHTDKQSEATDAEVIENADE